MQSNKQILATRRTYNKLVANEMMEDFALRFTAKRARVWSSNRVANTALGIVSFLVLEAIGGAITLNFGFVNTAWAILALVAVVFLTGLPISYYAAKYGVDIDLLSRGAGFGYIGSTIASLIYASFTFVFFALEAAIMSMALQLLFNIPLYLAYIISALVVLPLVSHGIATIGRFQVWTQPIWVILQLIPLYFVFTHPDSNFKEWISFTGKASENGAQFDLLLFGAASAVLLSLVAQIGEQVDFLRFLPQQHVTGKRKWWTALILAGPGWIIFGAMKLFLGSFLAYFALTQGVEFALADDPAHMYKLAFGLVFDNASLILLVTCGFVVISQLKINVANAYAGSLAWSNFFSRVTRNHPGRVVWMVFNVAIALLLMELGIYQTIESMLAVFSVVVLAWLSSVTADLLINKNIGLSPKQIEFKRAQLYDINPVGVGSMFIATFFGFTSHMGWYGELAKAMGSYIACGLPFITVPLIAYLTKGKYYIVKRNYPIIERETECHICENSFEQEDMIYCPAYQKPICSLCCSLDVRCGDKCRPKATLHAQSLDFFNRFLNIRLLRLFVTPLAQFIGLTLALGSVAAAFLYLIYLQQPLPAEEKELFFYTLVKTFFLLLILIGIVSWLFILARSGNRSALNELRSLTNALFDESQAHEKTALALQDAKTEADNANKAKSRYLASLSHELRTPLSVMLGYTQLMQQDQGLSPENKSKLGIMKRNGEHLSDLIEGLLEISKIEVGRLTLQKEEFDLKNILQQLVDMFQIKAAQKNITFIYEPCPNMPQFVASDKQRFRQILINLISNAIQYTDTGSVTLSVNYRNQVASFRVIDTGIGISEQDQINIFKPFEQISDDNNHKGGAGLGLTISRSLADLMGGEISVASKLGEGTIFTLKLMLVQLDKKPQVVETDRPVIGYTGKQYNLLVVDDDMHQRNLLRDLLAPLGFMIFEAKNGKEGIEQFNQHIIDLIILDIRMPVMDGWSMLNKLRDITTSTPVIMLTADPRDVQAKHANNHLYNDFMSKPINLDILLGKISSILNISWLQSENNRNISALAENKALPLAGYNEYKMLISFAEIGYLSGFKQKFADISEQFSFPAFVVTKIEQYIDLCDFPKMIQLLEEQCHE